MTTTPPVDLLVAAVNAQIGQIGPGVYGVACSGGADSLALADAAIRAAGSAHVILLVIDHGLTEGSRAAAAGVSAWATGQGAGCVIRRVEVRRGGSLEAAARAARYAALDELADELGLVCVMTGHTARDQAETVLLRILRGTGPAGLAAIPARRGRYVRPLLALDRAVIDAYAAARALPVWMDPMNADLRLARVRVREEILPALRRENPRLDAALVRLADSATEWLEVIDGLARPLASWPLDTARLAVHPPAVRKRALSLALEAAALDYDAHHLDSLDRLIASPEAGQRTIEVRGGAVIRSYGALTIAPQISTADAPQADLPAISDDNYEVRIWRAGDRMRPARLKGRSRKLSDLYIDAKLPRARRERARVVVRRSDRAIVWAEHVGAAFGEPSLDSGESRASGDPPKPVRSDGKF